MSKLHESSEVDGIDRAEADHGAKGKDPYHEKGSLPNSSSISGDDPHMVQVSQHDGSESSSETSAEIFQFDVYEREGFDQIMRTVAGASDEQEAFARSVCDHLEIFESLTPGREKVGYMVVCQSTSNRFGNRRFQTSSEGYLDADLLHRIVNDMHSELLVLTSRKNSGNRKLTRSFPHQSDPSRSLELVASLIRHRPAVSLLVSRIKQQQHR